MNGAARFLKLRRVSSWSANWTSDSTKRPIGSEGTGIKRGGEVIAKVSGRAISECRTQGFVDVGFERADFGDANSLLHFIGIESLKALDALAQPLDTTPRRFEIDAAPESR